MKNKNLKNIGPWLGAALLVGCGWMLYHEFETYQFKEIADALRALPIRSILASALFTAVDFGVLFLCEITAFIFIQKTLPLHKILWTSFTAYSFSNSVGFSGLSGASIRYRFYSSRGIPAGSIAKLIAFINVYFAIGFLLLAGTTFISHPFVIPLSLRLPFRSSFPLGILFLICVAAYLIWLYSHNKPFKIKTWEFELPARRLSFLQIALSALDFLLIGAAFYFLLPSGHTIPFFSFIAVYLLALAAGIISQVPGGLGVFETVMVFTLPELSKSAILGSLLAFRAVYYLLPLCIGAILLGWHELRHHFKESVKKLPSKT